MYMVYTDLSLHQDLVRMCLSLSLCLCFCLYTIVTHCLSVSLSLTLKPMWKPAPVPGLDISVPELRLGQFDSFYLCISSQYVTPSLSMLLSLCLYICLCLSLCLCNLDWILHLYLVSSGRSQPFLWAAVLVNCVYRVSFLFLTLTGVNIFASLSKFLMLWMRTAWELWKLSGGTDIRNGDCKFCLP